MSRGYCGQSEPLPPRPPPPGSRPRSTASPSPARRIKRAATTSLANALKTRPPETPFAASNATSPAQCGLLAEQRLQVTVIPSHRGRCPCALDLFFPLSLPKAFSRRRSQPRPWWSTRHPSGSGVTKLASPAPWHVPNVWPPAISGTVSSSFPPSGRRSPGCPSRRQRNGVAVESLRIHIDQDHRHGA